MKVYGCFCNAGKSDKCEITEKEIPIPKHNPLLAKAFIYY